VKFTDEGNFTCTFQQHIGFMIKPSVSGSVFELLFPGFSDTPVVLHVSLDNSQREPMQY
jgi:hypothetical protein